ncbi:MAG: YkgJ family cysteine cluster protein [Desulfobacterales bacterium]
MRPVFDPITGRVFEKRPRQSCTRCGTCCRKGGPAMHLEDKPLIERGDLHLRDLMTIRNGEPAYDNIRGETAPATSDIIKIKSRQNDSACIFYDDANRACGIYRNRPLECRMLKCWDTRDILTIYNRNRLSRFDLIGMSPEWWDLVNDHQNRCSYDDVLIFVNTAMKTGEKDAILEKKAAYAIRYDMEIRVLIRQNDRIDSEKLNFLFGRPMTDTLSSMGVRVHYRNGKPVCVITPSNPS